MKEKILIVEDQFVEADYLRLILVKAGYDVIGIARSVVKAQEIMKQTTPDLVLLDIFLKGKLTGIDLALQLKNDNIAFIYLSANSNEEVLTAAKATQPSGFLVKPFREKDLLVTLEIAQYRHNHIQESALNKESILQQQLTHIISEYEGREQKLAEIGKAFQSHIPFDLIVAGFNSTEDIGFLRIGYDQYQTIRIKELLTITGLTMAEVVTLSANTMIDTAAMWYNDDAFEKICKQPSLKKLYANTFQMRSHLSFPLHLPDGTFFHFSFYSRRPDTYQADHISLFRRLEPILVADMSDKKKMVPDAAFKTTEITNIKAFEGIIGKSHLLLNVFDHIIQVAPADTSVLIMGESGTGKERIADCIHQLSPRKGQPFIKVNCAALPASLIESELFGHEKGAFTGAIERRTGKFEQADKGTIFLDEIGEMPLELQVKLLRVLQEKEIERVGSNTPIKVDVRIITATNRNLEKEVAEGRFRLDLYYRLNVFPLILPALRDRTEDIPALAYHFMNYYNRKTGKKITGLSDKILKNMMAYHWPGNIRELEHVIERSVLLTNGTTIEDALIPVSRKTEPVVEEVRMKTIHENERDYIITVLKKCNGRIWGAGAAAEVLNIPPSTLKSKMKKLGIKKEYIV